MKYKSDLFQGESKRIPAEEVWLNRGETAQGYYLFIYELYLF